ncbi:hypothetical protein [Aeromicrobium sp. PE09-221]|nr:hypothetical protein [Aeromicrobium sp. PE09-221]
MTDPLIEPAAAEDVAEQHEDVWEDEEPEQVVLPDEERPVPLDEPES